MDDIRIMPLLRNANGFIDEHMKTDREIVHEWLSAKATCGKIGGAHPVTLWRWCKAGTFPQPVYFGARRRWRLADVEAWIAAQVAKSMPPAQVTP